MREDWEIFRLNEICDIRPPKRELKKELNEYDLVSFVPMSHLNKEQKEFHEDEAKPLKEVYKSYTYFKDGDVLLAKITPCFENGKMGVASKLTNGVGFGSSEFIVYRPHSKLISEYLFYFFLLPNFRNVGEKMMGGAVGHQRIPKEFYEEFEISIPPLPEQKRIVAILDEAFEAIDQAKANIERNIQNAEELFQSKLNEIFSQRGEAWEVKKLKEVCVLQRGFDLPRKLRNDGDVPLVGSSGFIDKHSESKVKAPGVVTGRSGSIGNVFYVEEDFWPLNTVLYIKEFHGNLEKYIYYLLRHFDLKSYSSGAGVPTLNRNFVHDEVLSINTDIHKQRAIVGLLDELENEIQYLIRHYESKLFQLEELKKSILQKAFSGELTANEYVAA